MHSKSIRDQLNGRVNNVSQFISRGRVLSTLRTLNMLFILIFRLHGNTRKKRRHWVKPGRTDLWWSNRYHGNLLPEEWCQNIRMNYHNFMILVDSIY